MNQSPSERDVFMEKTAVPGNFTDAVVVRSKLLVEGYTHGRLVAKAYRASDTSNWFVGVFLNNRTWVVLAEIQHNTVTERLQRKVILAMLKELV
jgi:hypothetical protein